MAKNFSLSYKLVDNKIPCGGFNLLGGAVKGKDISLVRQLNGLAVDKEAQGRIHLLLLNENDCIKNYGGYGEIKNRSHPSY